MLASSAQYDRSFHLLVILKISLQARISFSVVGNNNQVTSVLLINRYKIINTVFKFQIKLFYNFLAFLLIKENPVRPYIALNQIFNFILLAPLRASLALYWSCCALFSESNQPGNCIYMSEFHINFWLYRNERPQSFYITVCTELQ